MIDEKAQEDRERLISAGDYRRTRWIDVTLPMLELLRRRLPLA